MPVAPELQRWTRLVLRGLARDPNPPREVVSTLGRGLHLRLISGPATWLHLCLTPAGATPEAFARTEGTALRYLGLREPSAVERRWLERVGQELHGLDARPGWREFLAGALAAPSLPLPVEPPPDGRRLTSGGELLLRITGRCNARCRFCSARGLLPDLVPDLDAVRTSLRRGWEAGQRSVSFTGGEPCLVPWLPEALAEASSRGFARIGLQTHGMYLAAPGLRERLVDVGLTWAFMSLHSARAEVHDALLGRRGAFARALAAAEALGAAGVELGFNCVLTRLNLAGTGELVRLLADRFDATATHLCLSFCSPQGRALDYPDLMPDLAEVAPAMELGIQTGLEVGLRVTIPGVCGVPMCVLPGRLEHFDEYHEEHPPELPERGYLPGCARCRLRPRCSGFWSAYLGSRGSAGLGPAAFRPPRSRRRRSPR